jgi:hypothetical protein
MYGFSVTRSVNGNYFFEQRQNLMFLTVKCGVLFEVRTEFLKII